MNKDKKRDVIIKTPIIRMLLIPFDLIKDNSSLSVIPINKNCVDIIKIKGNMSYNTDGMLSRVNKIG